MKGEVVEADEAGLVNNGTRDGRHAGHGGERGGEQAEGNAATAGLLCGLLEDRTWAMMPQRGGRSPTADGVLGDAGWSAWGVDVGQVSDGGWGWRLGPGAPGRTRTRLNAGASRFSWWTTRWKRSARRACIMRRIWSMVDFRGRGPRC